MHGVINQVVAAWMLRLTCVCVCVCGGRGDKRWRYPSPFPAFLFLFFFPPCSPHVLRLFFFLTTQHVLLFILSLPPFFPNSFHSFILSSCVCPPSATGTPGSHRCCLIHSFHCVKSQAAARVLDLRALEHARANERHRPTEGGRAPPSPWRGLKGYVESRRRKGKSSFTLL